MKTFLLSLAAQALCVVGARACPTGFVQVTDPGVQSYSSSFQSFSAGPALGTCGAGFAALPAFNYGVGFARLSPFTYGGVGVFPGVNVNVGVGRFGRVRGRSVSRTRTVQRGF